MKNLRLFFEDLKFSKMLKLKAKLGITWNEVIARGLKGNDMFKIGRQLGNNRKISKILKGGRNGKSKDN